MTAGVYQATHTVPASGLQAWSTPDGTQPAAARLDPGLDVQVVELRGQWANVRCSNEWTAWVDGAALVAIGASASPAPPAGPPHASVAPAAAPAGAARESTSYAKPVGLVAAALVGVGAFMPWFSYSGFDFNAFHVPIDFLWSIDSPAKADADAASIGTLVVVLALAIGASAVVGRRRERQFAGSVANVVCVVYAIEVVRSLNDIPDAPGVFSVLGAGVYVSLIGALTALIMRGTSRRA